VWKREREREQRAVWKREREQRVWKRERVERGVEQGEVWKGSACPLHPPRSGGVFVNSV